MNPLLLDQQVIRGRYQLLKQIGIGGTSAVYEARHQLTEEHVAIKVIPLRSVTDSKTMTRFMREAKLTQKIHHSGVVKIIDAWIDTEEEHECYLVMELLRGYSLRECLQAQLFTRSQAVNCIYRTLSALAFTHREQIIHRDLKPENIFLHSPESQQGQLPTNSVVKILDFGLSRSVFSPSVTQTGHFVGTPWYMSPEQAFSPKECGPTTDIWSLGVILYEVLTDRVPFNGDSVPMICMAIKQDPHQAVHDLNPQVPLALSKVVDRCLAKSPADRYPNAEALETALSPILSKLGAFLMAQEISIGELRETPSTLVPDSMNDEERSILKESMTPLTGTPPIASSGMIAHLQQSTERVDLPQDFDDDDQEATDSEPLHEIDIEEYSDSDAKTQPLIPLDQNAPTLVNASRDNPFIAQLDQEPASPTQGEDLYALDSTDEDSIEDDDSYDETLGLPSTLTIDQEQLSQYMLTEHARQSEIYKTEKSLDLNFEDHLPMTHELTSKDAQELQDMLAKDEEVHSSSPPELKERPPLPKISRVQIDPVQRAPDLKVKNEERFILSPPPFLTTPLIDDPSPQPLEKLDPITPPFLAPTGAKLHFQKTHQKGSEYIQGAPQSINPTTPPLLASPQLSTMNTLRVEIDRSQRKGDHSTYTDDPSQDHSVSKRANRSYFNLRDPSKYTESLDEKRTYWWHLSLSLVVFFCALILSLLLADVISVSTMMSLFSAPSP
jgi:serine/threonine protein kinase